RENNHRNSIKDALLYAVQASVSDHHRSLLQDAELRSRRDNDRIRRRRMKVVRLQMSPGRQDQLPLRPRGKGIENLLQELPAAFEQPALTSKRAVAERFCVFDFLPRKRRFVSFEIYGSLDIKGRLSAFSRARKIEISRTKDQFRQPFQRRIRSIGGV